MNFYEIQGVLPLLSLFFTTNPETKKDLSFREGVFRGMGLVYREKKGGISGHVEEDLECTP